MRKECQIQAKNNEESRSNEHPVSVVDLGNTGIFYHTDSDILTDSERGQNKGAAGFVITVCHDDPVVSIETNMKTAGSGSANVNGVVFVVIEFLNADYDSRD